MSPTGLGLVPRALRKGDTIALVSPSSRFNAIFPSTLARGISYLESLGFRTITILSPLPPNRTHHQEIMHRCSELHQAFSDPSVTAILCTTGGEFANELLPYLDYELIRKNPKIFCGYSDITILHYAIYTQTGLHTFYGPCAMFEFGENYNNSEMLDFTTRDFLRVLSGTGGEVSEVGAAGALGSVPRSDKWSSKWPEGGDDPDSEEVVKERKCFPNPGWKWLKAGRATGRIFGGCLPLIQQAKGTNYFPDHRGRILVWETPLGLEDPGKPYPLSDVRSHLVDLRNAGVLDEIVGMVVGRPHCAWDEEMMGEFESIVLDQCEGRDFPVLMGVDFGHTDPQLTIPLNAMARMDDGEDVFEIVEATVVVWR